MKVGAYSWTLIKKLWFKFPFAHRASTFSQTKRFLGDFICYICHFRTRVTVSPLAFSYCHVQRYCRSSLTILISSKDIQLFMWKGQMSVLERTCRYSCFVGHIRLFGIQKNVGVHMCVCMCVQSEHISCSGKTLRCEIFMWDFNTFMSCLKSYIVWSSVCMWCRMHLKSLRLKASWYSCLNLALKHQDMGGLSDIKLQNYLQILNVLEFCLLKDM